MAVRYVIGCSERGRGGQCHAITWGGQCHVMSSTKVQRTVACAPAPQSVRISAAQGVGKGVGSASRLGHTAGIEPNIGAAELSSSKAADMN